MPIGDRFTMGGAVAALACQRYFKFSTAIPCHYGSFPIIDQTPENFVVGMDSASTKVATPAAGGVVTV
ncbi:metal-dependent hydrolase [compost metagenome]